MLQANLTEVSVRRNDDMRRISAWAAMWAIPTLVAGIYGMNFRHLPALDWRFGYPLVLVVMGGHLPVAVPRIPAQRLAVGARLSPPQATAG